MQIITLTTDYSNKDHYVASLKGMLYHLDYEVTLTDIAHDIVSGDIISASYLVNAASKYYPDETIHIINVGARSNRKRNLLILRNNQYFICPDNGVVTLMFPKEDFEAWILEEFSENPSFSDWLKAQLLIVKSILLGNKEDVMRVTHNYQVSVNLQPIITNEMLKGAIIYTDYFGNVVVNIDRETFYDTIQSDRYLIQFRNYRIQQISVGYDEVPEGEVACIFNENGFLEIGINQGSASELLGLSHGSTVLIEKQV